MSELHLQNKGQRGNWSQRGKSGSRRNKYGLGLIHPSMIDSYLYFENSWLLSQLNLSANKHFYSSSIWEQKFLLINCLFKKFSSYQDSGNCSWRINFKFTQPWSLPIFFLWSLHWLPNSPTFFSTYRWFECSNLYLGNFRVTPKNCVRMSELPQKNKKEKRNWFLWWGGSRWNRTTIREIPLDMIEHSWLFQKLLN